MKTADFTTAFTNPTPVFAMLHLSGTDAADKLDRAKREIDLLWDNGVDAVIVENYFGDTDDVVRALDYLVAERPDVQFGINVLKDDWRAFELAGEYGARFVQLDSVVGHVTPDDDVAFAAELAQARAAAGCLVFGGVRFKYQPYLSGRSLATDLALAVDRCDAIVVTGEGTGLETPTDKVAEFRLTVGSDFPLIVGAGVTAVNAATQLSLADAVIVGSTLKDTRVDTGDVVAENVATFVEAIRGLRRS